MLTAVTIGSAHILLSPLQMETITKILIKMRPLSTDRAIFILVSINLFERYLVIESINILVLPLFQSDFPKDSDMIESFQCSETQTNRYVQLKVNL